MGTWHWPQWLWAVLNIIMIVSAFIDIGSLKGNSKFLVTLFSVAVGVLYLYYGGFFLGNHP